MSKELLNEEVVDNSEVLTQPEKPKKGKKKKSKARSIIEWVITGIFALLFVIVGIGQIDGMVHAKDNYGYSIRFGMGTFQVKTDSMEPKYKVGTFIITQKKSAKVIYEAYLAKKTVDVTFMNGIVSIDEKPSDTSRTFNVTDKLVITHRIIEVKYNPDASEKEQYIFYAAGINLESEHLSQANQYQAFYYDQILGVVSINSPFLGRVVDVISSPIGLLIFLLIPAFYLIITSVLDITKTLKDKDDEPKAEVITGGGASSLDGLSEEDKKRLKEEMLEEMLHGGKKDE